MPQLVTLAEDGPLGEAGTQVWVDDAEQASQPAKRPAKKAQGKSSGKSSK